MPRNVRNFWIELEVDGRSTKVAAGPQAKDGGFSASIKMRTLGGIVRVGHLAGRVDGASLILDWVPDDPNFETINLAGTVR